MYRIPTDKIRYEMWCNAIGSHVNPPIRGFICVNHFHQDDLNRRGLKQNAIPSIFPNENEAKNPNNLSVEINETHQTGGNDIFDNESPEISQNYKRQKSQKLNHLKNQTNPLNVKEIIIA